MKQIDLNADIGEGAAYDIELLEIISSASIACGAHAGDEGLIRKTLRAAKAKNVTCGAHPGFADKENFGRLALDLPISMVQKQVADQLALIQKIANEENIPLAYVKLHGALANMAAKDLSLAMPVFETIKKHDANLSILALDNSTQVIAAKQLGLNIILEAYADRKYENNGLLVSRQKEGAIITNDNEAVAQCLRLAQKNEIITIDGSIIYSSAKSICLHGDNKNAISLAKNIAKALINAGINIHSAL